MWRLLTPALLTAGWRVLLAGGGLVVAAAAMYAPELKANSDEIRLRVED